MNINEVIAKLTEIKNMYGNGVVLIGLNDDDPDDRQLFNIDDINYDTNDGDTVLVLGDEVSD